MLLLRASTATSAISSRYEVTCPLPVPDGPRPLTFLLSLGFVEGHCLTHENHQRRLINVIALAEVDRAPGVPFKTGVEQTRGILQSRTFGEGHLDDALVSLTGAYQSVV